MNAKNPKRKRRKVTKTGLPRSSKAAGSVQLAQMGLAGVSQNLVARHYTDPDDPRNAGGLVGLPGLYKVVFTFSRPGYPLLPENRYSWEAGLEGDSHLAIAKPAYSDPNNPDADQIRIYAQTPEGSFTFTGFPNAKGFLGKMELEPLNANDIRDAELKAHRALASALSNVSVYLDIPLHVYQMHTTELRTGTARMPISVAYRELPLCLIPTDAMTPEFRAYASLYREALNNSSPVYQFLCYYRIIEGVRNRRARINKESRAKGEPIIPSPKQTVPGEADDQINWLNSIFPLPQTWDKMILDQVFLQCTLGRKVFDIVEKEIKRIRNRIAHFVLDSGELTILADEGEDINTVIDWLPLVKCITRFLIKAEFPGVFDR